jgi:CBS-domain-containing membrane protein
VANELAVASVMTTRVVTVEPETSLRELVAKMTEFRVRAVPVVDRYRQPIGVVSRADLPPQHGFPGDLDGRPHGDRGGRERWYHARGRTAADLMTTPVRAIHADEPVSFAARLLAKARLRRLFVVNWDSRLVGVVARCDLLRVFPRGDDELRTQIADMLHAAKITSGAVEVRVDAGVVTVSGVVARHGLADTIVRMIRALPGVTDVRDNLGYLVDEVVDEVFVGGARNAGSEMAQRVVAADVRFPLPAARARPAYQGGFLERVDGSATSVPWQRHP